MGLDNRRLLDALTRASWKGIDKSRPNKEVGRSKNDYSESRYPASVIRIRKFFVYKLRVSIGCVVLGG